MKKIQLISFCVLGLSVILWTAGRTVLPLHDWTVRINGALMIISMVMLVFSTVRLSLK